MKQLSLIWNRVSRIGLRDEEGVAQFREVIFLNRLLAIIPLLMGVYIPLEIYLNGYSMLPVVGLMICTFLLPLPLHYFRLFRLAQYVIFISANVLITWAGLLVGQGVNNHVALIPVVLVATILFRSNSERIIAFFITLCFYFTQVYLFKIVTPVMPVTDNNKESFTVIFFVMSMLLSFLSGMYFIRLNRDYENIIIGQNEELAFKNNEITASINYAKRIQSAILPSASTIKRLLPHSFVLYKPKDIVAGDFYWVENANDLVLFAAADSTGHGVPGAMVSVVCHNALVRSVREFNLTEPSLILNKTREIVLEQFADSEEDVNDGMDISLCAFDPQSLELKWSGANNPLLVMRPGEIIELRADKQPVGRFSSAKPFTSHTLQLQQGDVIYIFTDGYADQFGGPAGKKFKYSALKNLLSSIASKDPQSQSEVLSRTLEQWQGKLEQVDDICIMGISV